MVEAWFSSSALLEAGGAFKRCDLVGVLWVNGDLP